MIDADAALGQAAIVARAARLTRRERQVLALIGLGYHQAEIADKLGSSEDTVKNQLYSARERLGARTSAHAACLLLRAEQYAARAEAGEHGGAGYRAALGAIRGIIAALGPLEAEVAALAGALERLAQDAARRGQRAS